MTIEPAVTIAAIEDELPGLRSYAERHGWSVNWNPVELILQFTGHHPKQQRAVRILADVRHYRCLPPIWTFADPGAQPVSPYFPKPGALPNGKSSIFHSNGVICAPFNRLAFHEHGGPHRDWGGAAAWLEVNRANEVRATTLAAMFAIILGHLHASPGMN